MKKNHMKVSILIIGLIVLSSQFAFASPDIVINPGDDIVSMFNAAANGDVIQINEGVYKIGQELDLSGKSNLLIYGLGQVKFVCEDVYSIVIRINACSNLTFDNLHFTHDPVAGSEHGCSGAVCLIENSSMINFNNCRFNGCGTIGLWTESCDSLTLTRCEIYENSIAAFWFFSTDNVNIFECYIHNNNSFIDAWNSPDINFILSTVVDNGTNNDDYNYDE